MVTETMRGTAPVQLQLLARPEELHREGGLWSLWAERRSRP